MLKEFSDLGVNEKLQQSLVGLEISIPTDIQKEAIPVVLNQKDDLVVLAKTGTGKTVAFGLPLLQMVDLENNAAQTLILAPTRELGQQIYNNLVAFAADSPEIVITSICGGTPIKPQIELLKSPTHIVVGTPGRLVDLMKRGAICLKNIKHLVLDEADEMVSALKEEVDIIIKKI